MPVHDWTRVGAGIFHDFHHAWIEEIKRALNGGLLPSGYYALAEQWAGHLGPDVLDLQSDPPDDGGSALQSGGRMTAVAESAPKVRFTAQTESDYYAAKQSTLVVRHASGDRIVALVEIVSKGNKASRAALRSFVEKAASALFRGYHLLILDLHPPTARDPQGIHGAIWEEIAENSYHAPHDKPLTLVSYDAGPPKTAYTQPIAVGDVLPEMPLFVEPQAYITLPLDATCQSAWHNVPQRWRHVLEG